MSHHNRHSKGVIKILFNGEIGNEFHFISEFTILWSIFESRFRTSQSSSLGYLRINVISNSPEIKKAVLNKSISEAAPKNIILNKINDDLKVTIEGVEFNIRLLPVVIEKEFKFIKEKFFKSNDILDIDQTDERFHFAILYLVYRVRNNLFHGNKDFATLHEQEELFNILNKYLANFLIETKDIVLS